MLSFISKRTKICAFIKFAKTLALATAMFLPLLLPLQAHSSTKLQDGMDMLAREKTPLAEKLYLWLDVTQNANKHPSKDLIEFINQNQDFPQRHKFREMIEQSVGQVLNSEEVASWFKQYPPKTYNGISYYIDALLDMGETENAKRSLRKFWVETELDQKELKRLSRKYNRFFSPTDHIDRLDYLLWEERYNDAKQMFYLVDTYYQEIALARIALGRMAANAEKAVKKLTPEQRRNEGVIYDRAKWRRRMDNDAGAIEMLQVRPQRLSHYELWWQEMNIMARRAIEDKKYSLAYMLASQHKLEKGTEDYAHAEWLQGWLALNFLNKPDKAYQHFENLYYSASSSISRSRAAYWLALADERMGRKTAATNWYKLAAELPFTFYGQLAREKAGSSGTIQFTDEAVEQQTKDAYFQQDLVQAIKLLIKYDLGGYTEPFFKKLMKKAATKTDYLLIGKLANEVKQIKYAVEANRQLQQKLGETLFFGGFPILSATPRSEVEKALVHAIIYRESMFDIEAGSYAGAKGLMQLMPRTANELANKMGVRHKDGKLTSDPYYNIQLGSAYLANLLKRYDGYYPLAIAAYNAGPANVSKWLKAFGDPREKKTNIVNWLELIPIQETRNYVQRVMETYYIYKLKLSEQPKTVLDF